MKVFAEVLTCPFKYIRSKGHLSVKYIDDSLLLGETFEVCFKNITATVALLWRLGFTIHPEKVSPSYYTTDNIPRVCDRLCQNDNTSD